MISEASAWAIDWDNVVEAMAHDRAGETRPSVAACRSARFGRRSTRGKLALVHRDSHAAGTAMPKAFHTLGAKPPPETIVAERHVSDVGVLAGSVLAGSVLARYVTQP